MKRRFQFRLRTLLTLLVAVCTALGAWHLYSAYFGPYVEPGPAVVGQPFVVRGRFFDFLGLDQELFTVNVIRRLRDGRRLFQHSQQESAKRTGLWAYDFELEVSPVMQEGEYEIMLLPVTRAVLADYGRFVAGDAQVDTLCSKAFVVKKGDRRRDGEKK